MNEQFSIAGKVAVITGAGGVLGGSIARHFISQGARVVALDIRKEQLDKRVEELRAAGGEAIGFEANVLDIPSLEQVRDQILGAWGRIDILVNIAGGNMPGATLTVDQTIFDMKIEDYDKVIRERIARAVEEKDLRVKNAKNQQPESWQQYLKDHSDYVDDED